MTPHHHHQSALISAKTVRGGVTGGGWWRVEVEWRCQGGGLAGISQFPVKYFAPVPASSSLDSRLPTPHWLWPRVLITCDNQPLSPLSVFMRAKAPDGVSRDKCVLLDQLGQLVCPSLEIRKDSRVKTVLSLLLTDFLSDCNVVYFQVERTPRLT